MPQLIIRIVGDAKQLNRELARTQGRLQKFDRSVGGMTVFGGRGGALAFGGLAAAAGLKSAVTAAANAQVILGQTSVAVEDAGLAWQQNSKRIEDAANRISKASSFDDEAVLQSFQVFVRGQKNIEKSLRLSALAADVARGRYIDLDSATQLVNKAAMGQVGALRRAGIQIDKNATSTEALAALEEAYGGAAVKYSESAIGAHERLQVSIENLQEQIGSGLLPVVEQLATELSLAADAGERLGGIKLPGGFGGLLQKGALMPGMLPIFAGQTIYNQLFGGGGGGGAGAGLGGGGGTAAGLRNLLNAARQRGAGGNLRGMLGSTGFLGIRPGLGLGPSVGQRNQWFDNMITRLLGRVNDPTSLRQQIGRLRTVAGLVQQRLQVTKDITRWLKLEDLQADIAVEIRGRQDEIARRENAKAAAKRATAADVAESLREQLRKDKERQLGWLEFGLEKAEVTKTLADNRRMLRLIEKYWLDRIRHEGRTLQAVREVWRTRQAIRDLNKKNADADPLAGLMQVSSRRMANLLGAGLGLNQAGLGRLQANIAGQEIHNYVYMDGRQVAHSVNRANAQSGHRTSRQTSGFRG